MGDVWRKRRGNNNVWREVSKRYVHIQRQRMEASKRKERSLVLYNELKNNRERVINKKVCTYEKRRGTGLWETGIWKQKAMRGHIDQKRFPVCRKEK
jgi:hypothetical protein